MEEKAAGADDEVPDEGDEEDRVVLLLDAVYSAAQTESKEGEVGEGVDYFGGVDCCVVVLDAVSIRREVTVARRILPPHTNSASK